MEALSLWRGVAGQPPRSKGSVKTGTGMAAGEGLPQR